MLSFVRKLCASVLGWLHGRDPGADAAGKPRSGKWAAVERAHLRRHPRCAVCGGKKALNVHHVEPYHLAPQKELNRRNLITLCRGPLNCHLLFGHLGDYKAHNPFVRLDAAVWRGKLRRKRWWTMGRKGVKREKAVKGKKGVKGQKGRDGVK